MLNKESATPCFKSINSIPCSFFFCLKPGPSHCLYVQVHEVQVFFKQISLLGSCGPGSKQEIALVI
jgi:hypothetical protein